MNDKIKNLIDYSQGILNGESGEDLYAKYETYIDALTPSDLFEIENEQLNMGHTPKELLVVVDKLINAFYKALSDYKWEKPKEETFLYYLLLENKGLLDKLSQIKELLKSSDSLREDYLPLINSLLDYNQHLLKLENILFPYLEKEAKHFEGLKIMWSLHDGLRSFMKSFIQDFQRMEKTEFMKAIGQVFFYYNGLVKKQELILFPTASQLLTEEMFEAMHQQSFDYEFPYIDHRPTLKSKLKSVIGGNGQVHMATGQLTFEQIETMLNALPVDITFVDANDEVAYFSRPKDRFFPRSVAIIGRNVRNCHPPESVHVVEKIIENFRNGERDQENFWIQMRGQFILIQYFALRNDQGLYIGCLEVSQEISEIKALEGEKRLLDD